MVGGGFSRPAEERRGRGGGGERLGGEKGGGGRLLREGGRGEGEAGEGLILIQDSSLLGQLSFFLQPLSFYNFIFFYNFTSSYKPSFLQLFLFSNIFRSFNSRAPFQSSLFYSFRSLLF